MFIYVFVCVFIYSCCDARLLHALHHLHPHKGIDQSPMTPKKCWTFTCRPIRVAEKLTGLQKLSWSCIALRAPMA